MNKSILTNIVALLITLIGIINPFENSLLLMIGLFSLSGGITNWIAIHMLFEKVPFVYGSGIIPKNFLIFKQAIKDLVIKEFFSRNNVEVFTSKISEEAIISISKNINYNNIFEGLTESIESSQLGGMLSMVGGKKALEPLRKPIIIKLETLFKSIIENEKRSNFGDEIVDNVYVRIEKLIDDRLNELSPQDVKKIIQNLIDKHLGWLVIWGGVFGGFIGIISFFVSLFFI
ncbi:MAG: DUF445 domain-containing protein [Candidatus Puniceispirillales bacterium]|jgi:uncharacterized membrane protein YheB (UPF0754 family)|tara:strand:- start:735 stop:1427 length:693 start_codon:yes stop_codon:yes gene_type:complete